MARKLGWTLTRLAMSIPRLAMAIGDALEDAGYIATADDAEDVARRVSEEVGDMIVVRVKRGGERVDVVDADGQADLAALIARIAWRLQHGRDSDTD